MTTIQIVPETACVKFLDDNGNMKDYFFINQYQFKRMTSDQLTSLKTRLEKETVHPIVIYQHIESDTLFLTCINEKFKDSYTTAFTFSFNTKGNETAHGYDYYEKYIANDTRYHIVHDFVTTKYNKSLY